MATEVRLQTSSVETPSEALPPPPPADSQPLFPALEEGVGFGVVTFRDGYYPGVSLQLRLKSDHVFTPPLKKLVPLFYVVGKKFQDFNIPVFFNGNASCFVAVNANLQSCAVGGSANLGLPDLVFLSVLGVFDVRHTEGSVDPSVKFGFAANARIHEKGRISAGLRYFPSFLSFGSKDPGWSLVAGLGHTF